MSSHYLAALSELEDAANEALAKLRGDMIADGVPAEKISEQAMKVELFSLLLINAMNDEYAFNNQPVNAKQARRTAQRMIQQAVLAFRRHHADPPSSQLKH